MKYKRKFGLCNDGSLACVYAPVTLDIYLYIFSLTCPVVPMDDGNRCVAALRTFKCFTGHVP